jgi:hypothetical protein
VIDSDKVWPLLLDELREQRARYERPTMAGQGALKWQGHGKIAAYCRVLALDDTNDVTYREPDKVLLEANHRLDVRERETRRRAEGIFE